MTTTLIVRVGPSRWVPVVIDERANQVLVSAAGGGHNVTGGVGDRSIARIARDPGGLGFRSRGKALAGRTTWDGRTPEVVDIRDLA